MPPNGTRLFRGTWLPIGALFVLGATWVTPVQAAKITYAGWGSPAEIKSIANEIVAFLKKYPNLGIEIENQFVPWEGYHEKLVVQAAAGALPDIMLISGGFFVNIEAYNVFLDLRPYFKRDGLREDYLPKGTINFLTVNGKMAGLPAGGFRSGAAMVNYNKNLFERAGLEVPSWHWTWNDLLVYARRLTKDVNGSGGEFVPATSASPWPERGLGGGGCAAA